MVGNTGTLALLRLIDTVGCVVVVTVGVTTVSMSDVMIDRTTSSPLEEGVNFGTA